MKYILINGKKRSGKDYIAQLIKFQLEKNGNAVEVLSFADPVKDLLCTTFDISIEQLNKFKNDEERLFVEDEYKKGYDPITNFRKVLQRFATEAMQGWFGQDVWVQLLQQCAHNLDVDYVIIPDFRFKHEYIEGAITVTIKNDTVKAQDDHKSENDLSDFNFMHQIDNTGYGDVDLTQLMEDLLRR